MKVSNDIVVSLIETIRLSTLFKIEQIKWDDSGLSGINDVKTTFLKLNRNIPDLPDELIGGIGLSRLASLRSRLKLMDPVDTKMTIDTATNTIDSVHAKQLNFKCGNIRTNFKCYSPAKIKTPKVGKMVNVEPIVVDTDLLSFLKKSKTVMKSNIVNIRGGSETITYTITDVNADKLEYVTTNHSDFIGDYSYDLSTICTIMIELLASSSKGFSELNLSQAASGMVSADILDYTIYLRAKAK